MSGEIQYLTGEQRPRRNQRILWVKPGFRKAFEQVTGAVEPLLTLCDSVDDLRVDAERLASLA